MKKPKLTKQTRAVNAAIESVSREMKHCRAICAFSGAPLRSITYRFLDNGETKLHVTYKRK